MPSPLLSSGSALARMAASGMASSRPRPIIGGAMRAENSVSMQIAIPELADLQTGLAQLDLGAIGKAYELCAVADSHLTLWRHAGVGHVLQLAAVGGFGEHAKALDNLGMFAAGRNRQAYQHRHRADRIRRRRMAAAVLDMAVLAGVGVEQRAKAIARGGGGRCGDPGIAEEAVADAEI